MNKTTTTSTSEPTDIEPRAEARKNKPAKKLGFFEKLMWWVLIFFCGVWLMNPADPTDVIPLFNWLDEAAALFILVTALDKLGLEIPFLHNMLRNRTGGGSREEKDVTPS